MANNNNEGADNNPDNSKESGSEKSFVGKFMSGIINSTPLSKWFGKDPASRSIIRRRDEDEEFDTSFSFQPPSKRAKLPTDIERNNYSAHVFESPVTVHASNNVNNVSSKVFGKFPEPVPGPSGIKSRKLFEKHNTSSTNTLSADSFEKQLEIVNGDHDSDSGESTSGYSSAPKLVNKQNREEDPSNNETSDKVAPKTRSLFTPSSDRGGGRTLFTERNSQMNTSLSSRRPTFNASTFGSPNFVDRTLSTRRIMDSPFYSGRTIYGGASAYGRKLCKNTEESNTVRNSVQIKPVNEKSTNDNTTLSKTARRILSTLEQYSTPISDAKKIPVAPRKQGLLSTYVGASPYLVRDRKRPSNKELQVPSVPDLLQMKQKERLQNSTETVRQIATKSKSSLNKEEYKLRTEEDNKQKHSNKMKSSMASVRQQMQPLEPVGHVKLPKVSLPITTLPKFDFVLMPPSSSTETKEVNEVSKTSTVTKSPVSTIIKPTIVVERKETEVKIVEKVKQSGYTFSEPLVITKDLKPVAAINCFKFSDPVCKKQVSVIGETFKAGDSALKTPVFKMKNNGENVYNAETTKPSQLLTGSVMDVLGKKKGVSSPGAKKTAVWKCQTCLVKNDADKTTCIACDEPREQEESKGFGDQFKLTSDKWECDSCMVRNNNSDKNCVACATARPSADTHTGFGDKFKPPASTWECSSCLIRNKNDFTSCEACGTAKVAKGFGDKFKPTSDTWECSVCMIRNKNDLNKCAACETPKPGSKVAPSQKPVTFTSTTTGTTFTFGIKPQWECKTCLIKNSNDLKKCAACEMPRDSTETTKTGFGDAFKMKSGEWECSSCMVKNKPTVDVCVCCGVKKPGSSSEKLLEISKNEKKPVNTFNFGIDKGTASQFKFGIPAKTETKGTTAASTPVSFSFGDAAKTTAATSTTFTFGINTPEKVASSKAVTSEVATPTMTVNPLLKPNEKLPEKATTAPVGFKFDPDNSLNKNQNSETVVSSSSNKTEVSTPFSTSFTSTTTFQFKPVAVNGDISKPKESFSGDANKANMFGDTNKSKDNIFGSGTKTNESPFGKSGDSPFSSSSKSTDSPFGITNKPTETPFGGGVKLTDSPFGGGKKLSDSPFGTAKRLSDSPFGATSKPADSPFGTTSKPADSPFSNKSVNSPFANTNKSTESPFANTNKPVDSPFGTTSKPKESPFAPMTKTGESPFGNVNKSIESPFSKPNKPTESPFGISNKPTESPFATTSDGNKPKESLFGTPSDSNKSQGALFTAVNDTNTPSEALFSNDPTKPKEIIFGNKPPENTSLFAPSTSTAAFSFTPKSIESTTSNFPSSSTQPPTSAIFKFGADTSGKRSIDASDTVSNGFGTAPKMPAFGASQGFGTTENKPFAFGTTDAAPKPPGFSFGQAEKPNTTTPVFSFGSGPPQSQSSGAFNFSAPAPSTAFNFGAVGKVDAQPFSAPSGNVFGSAGSGAKNGSFNFGTNANNNNQKAVFTFGANQTGQPAVQPSFPTQGQSGFNFRAPAPMSAHPGTFNFPGAPPPFNFTDGNAGQSQSQPPRKIKKALRRTHR